jgi:hypothetical protein
MSAKKIFILLLAVILTIPTVLSACGDKDAAQTGDTTQSVTEDAETTEPDILEGLDFGGSDFRIQMSNTSISSADFMEDSGETNGDVVYSAVYNRNLAVAERLNVKFVYTDTDYNWDAVATNIRKLIQAGDDSFDLIVNDQIGLAGLAVEKMFANVNDCKYFDFNSSGWWDEYMKDLTIGNKKMYLLVGDYFIDVLRKSHVIYYNRDIFTDIFGDPDNIYKTVNDGKWTYDQMLEYINGAYIDVNGNSKIDKDDQFGMIIAGIGGSIFPYEYAGDPDFIERDENGIPSITIAGDRSDLLYQKIYNVFYSDATYTNYQEHADDFYTKFKSGGSLFISCVSIGDFDLLRDMESDVGILPYPKLDEEQDGYYTTIHDTAEIGAIPTTCANTDYASAVIQALCEESNSLVIPAYYETALKIKYARDDYSSQMIDLIYNGIKGLFPLVYGATYANNIFTWSFLEPLQKKSTAWVSSYESRIEAARTQLQSLIDAYTA